jgi:hypothetical protein
MTEAEWFAGTDAYKLSRHVSKGSPRKLRLFAVACARHVPAELIDDDCRKLLDASEASAEDLITPQERRKVEQAVIKLAQRHEDAWRKALHSHRWTSVAYRRYKAISACGMTSQANRDMIRYAAQEAADAVLDPQAEKLYQSKVLRCIYGNPFQPVTFDPQWRTAEVVELANAIFASWDVKNFRALEKALRQSGCDQAEILKHCRSKGPHVHGCWVIDLILGKK